MENNDTHTNMQKESNYNNEMDEGIYKK